MIISERNKSTCYLKCDKCGREWQGNYYVMKKRDVHYCPSCAFKKGWKEKFDQKPFLIPKELRPYIIKRLDGISLDKHFPKRKSLKIIIKCSNCGYERQSNSYDVINKNSTLCNSCKQKRKWNNGKNIDKKLRKIKQGFKNTPKRNNPEYRKNMSIKIKKLWKDKEYRDKQLATRKTKEYRKMMSEVIKNSDAWEKSQPQRIKSTKEYWKKKRGGKELHEILPVWNFYKKTVYKFTEKIYKKFEQIINPDNLPRGRGKYHIDHKFSVLEGFKNNIPPYIISHQSNLQMLKEFENIAKDCKCDITMEELFGGVFYSLVAE